MWLSRFESWPGSPAHDGTQRYFRSHVTAHPSTHPDAGDPPSTGGAGDLPSRPGPPGAVGLGAVVLAAGLGTRMRSRRHKVLHPLGGKPLILRVLDLLAAAGVERTVVVLGHLADQVEAVLPAGVVTIEQRPQLGTGHAVQMAADRLRELGVERLLVHYGD